MFYKMVSRIIRAEPNKKVVNGYDCDVYLPDVDVAIMWNGLWHFKNLMRGHSVAAVQNRDSYKIRMMVAAGITPYIVSDFGKHNPKFVRGEFVSFIKWLVNRVPFLGNKLSKITQLSSVV